jgi:uncharacterized membrane protein YraQ (UPF0718 family)
MDFLIEAAQKASGQTLVSLSHNWPYILASIVIAACMKAFVEMDRVSEKLTRYRGAGVFLATLGIPLYINSEGGMPMVPSWPSSSRARALRSAPSPGRSR